MVLTFAIILAASLLAIAYVDFRRLVIPDWLNATVFLSGAAFRLCSGYNALVSGLLFALAVIVFFWTVRYLHYRLRGVVGLGLGDVKFAGAAAVWLDPWSFPIFLLIAAATALLYFFVKANRSGNLMSLRVPFGPFLALSLFAVWNFNLFFEQTVR